METNHFQSAENTTRNAEPALWFLFYGQKLLVSGKELRPEVPLMVSPIEAGIHASSQYHMGDVDGVPCYVACLQDEPELPAGMMMYGMRELFGQLDDALYNMAVKGLGISNWDCTHFYCGRCGSKTNNRKDMVARQCPACDFTIFPRISPAVIVLVERDDKILLAHGCGFQENIYSVLAGFVEPGETLEDTVRREVKEETGIDVKDIRYFGSQPWPFPDSLMIGFTAVYASGEIIVDGSEILDAQWFDADHFPPMIPGKRSISRALIDSFLDRHAFRPDRNT